VRCRTTEPGSPAAGERVRVAVEGRGRMYPGDPAVKPTAPTSTAPISTALSSTAHPRTDRHGVDD
jgi:hypothetical protein